MSESQTYTADEVYAIFRELNGERNLWSLSKEFKVSHSSLQRRHQKFLKVLEEPDERLTMSPKEENMLFSYIIYLTKKKNPPSATEIRRIGAKMLEREGMLSSNWFDRFSRNHYDLKTDILINLDFTDDFIRHAGADDEDIKDFFEEYLEIQESYRLDDDHIFIIDEARFKIGGNATEESVDKTTYIVSEEDGRRVKGSNNESLKSVTVIEAISKSGKVGKPILIHNTTKSMMDKESDSPASSEKSKTGSIHEEIFLDWLDSNFANPDDKSCCTLLIMNDSTSYTTKQVYEKLAKLRIIQILIPSQMFKLLHFLNTACFKNAKTLTRTKIYQDFFGNDNNDDLFPDEPIQNQQATKLFFENYLNSRQNAFSPENIKNVFEITGLNSKDPQIALEKFRSQVPKIPTTTKNKESNTDNDDSVDTTADLLDNFKPFKKIPIEEAMAAGDQVVYKELVRMNEQLDRLEILRAHLIHVAREKSAQCFLLTLIEEDMKRENEQLLKECHDEFGSDSDEYSGDDEYNNSQQELKKRKI